MCISNPDPITKFRFERINFFNRFPYPLVVPFASRIFNFRKRLNFQFEWLPFTWFVNSRATNENLFNHPIQAIQASLPNFASSRNLLLELPPTTPLSSIPLMLPGRYESAFVTFHAQLITRTMARAVCTALIQRVDTIARGGF